MLKPVWKNLKSQSAKNMLKRGKTFSNGRKLMRSMRERSIARREKQNLRR